MDKTLSAVLLGSFITLIGVLLTLYFNRANLKLQLAHQSKQDAIKLKLAKLEEIHKSITEFINKTAIFANGLLIMKAEGISTREYEELNRTMSFSTVEFGTLIRIYAPELNHKYDEILATSLEVLILGKEFIDDGKEFETLHQKNKIIRRQCASLLKELENLSRLYSNLPDQ